MKSITKCLMVLLAAIPAWAGVGTSGGGSYVVIDGKITLADPYYAGVPISQTSKMTRMSYNELPKELRDYLDQTEMFLMNIFALDQRHQFFSKWVRTSDKHYVLVPKDRENNVPCDRYLPVLDRYVDNHFQYGCTFGPDTFLFVDKWKQAPLDVQAFAILHERLWAYKEQADQSDIAKFVRWAYTLEHRYISQRTQGERVDLPAEEVAGYAELEAASLNLTLIGEDYTKMDYSVLSGGALVSSQCIKHLKLSQTFLGLGTKISGSCNSLTLENSTILNSIFNLTSYQEMSVLSGIRNSTIQDSTLELHSGGESALSEIRGSIIKDSNLDGDSKGLNIVNSSVESSTIDGSQIISSKVNGSKIYLAKLDHSQANETELGEAIAIHSSVVITYATLDQTKLTADDVQISGTSDAVTRIRKTQFSAAGKKVEIASGVSLDNIDLSFYHEAIRSLKIGRDSDLRDLVVFVNAPSSESSSNRDPWLNAVSVAFENDTSLSNGRLILNPECGNAQDSFSFGVPGKPFRVDLKGTRVVLTSSDYSCKGALPDSGGNVSGIIDPKRFDGLYFLIPDPENGGINGADCAKTLIVQAITVSAIKSEFPLIYVNDAHETTYPILEEKLPNGWWQWSLSDGDGESVRGGCDGTLDCLIWADQSSKETETYRHGKDFVSYEDKERYGTTFKSIHKLSEDRIRYEKGRSAWRSEERKTTCLYQKMK